MGTVADKDTRIRAHIKAAEAGGWRVQATSRWEALYARRVGGEQVQMREDFNDELLRMGGGGRKDEVKKRSRQTIETGGEGGIV